MPPAAWPSISATSRSSLPAADEPATDPCRRVLATGFQRRCQERSYNLVTALDRERYDVSVLALSGGTGVGGSSGRRPGVVLDECPNPEAIAAVAAHLAPSTPRSSTPTVPGRGIGTQAPGRSPPPAGAGHSCGHGASSRVRSEEDRDLVRRLTPQGDHLIAVRARSFARSRTRVAPAPLEPHLQRLSTSPVLGAGDVLHVSGRVRDPPGAAVVASSPGSSREGPPDALEHGPPVPTPSRTHTPHRGRGLAAHALEGQAAGSGCSTTSRPSVHRASRRRSCRDRRARRRGPAELSRGPGLSILEAMALSRPSSLCVGGIPEMIEHGRTGILVPPRNPMCWRHRSFGSWTDHPYADTLARAATILSTTVLR